MSSPPREIQGSVGSRIRVVLGETGSHYLLLLNEDDGDGEWQDRNWSNIPVGLARQLNNCANKGRYVKQIDYGPTDSWFVNGIKRDGSGNHSWWGGTSGSETLKKGGYEKIAFGSKGYIFDGDHEESYVFLKGSNGYSTHNVDEDLLSRIKRLNGRKKAIDFIRLFENGAYFISDDEGMEWKGISTFCEEELKKPNIAVRDVAVAENGSWLIICDNTYIASTGLSETLTDRLDRFYREQTQRNANRSREIHTYHAQERARQAQERLERERAEREARERAERFRIQRQEQERAEGLAREAAERENLRVTELEQMLEERIADEAEYIKEQEENLRKRKRSLKASIEKLPRERRARYERNEDTCGECVVCQSAPAAVAVVPCGHQCLCDACAATISGSDATARKCPLCRVNLESTLKVYTSH